MALWQLFLYAIGAFYALLILPLIAYALWWVMREAPSFLKARLFGLSVVAGKAAAVAGSSAAPASLPSSGSTGNPSPSASPRAAAVNSATPKRIQVTSASSTPHPPHSRHASEDGRPVLKTSSFSSSASASAATMGIERAIRVQPSQSDVLASIHPLSSDSPFPSFSRLPSLESGGGGSRSSTAPPSPVIIQPPLAPLDGGDLSDDSDDQEMRVLEQYFTSSSLSLLALAGSSVDEIIARRAGFQKTSSSELHARIAVHDNPSAPPTPEVHRSMGGVYSSSFEGLGHSLHGSSALPSPSPPSSSSFQGQSLFSSPPAHHAALLIAKRATIASSSSSSLSSSSSSRQNSAGGGFSFHSSAASTSPSSVFASSSLPPLSIRSLA